MLNQDNKDFQGKIYQLQGNEPLLLDKPQMVWVIQSGAVALFAVEVKDGAIIGSRSYLFSCASGEALFGVSPHSNSENRSILAVPIEQTEVLLLHPECCIELVTSGNTQAIALIDNWVQKLGNTLSHTNKPAIQVQAEGESRVSLIDNQTLQPKAGHNCWIHIQQGTVCLMGLAELTLTSETDFFPLSDRMWLKANGTVQLITQTTLSIGDPNTILRGLSELHSKLLNYTNLLNQQQAQEEMRRLQMQERLNRQVTVEALGELASTLNTKDTHLFTEGVPLLVVAGAVGRSIGITINPPARSENLERVKEPLEAIARSSKLRIRKVLLRDKWWQKNAGPLVAYTLQDKQPVALLPISPTRYELFDPSKQTRTPVDAEIADTLDPFAYTFCQSLPDKALKALGLIRFAFKDTVRDLLITFVCGIVISILGMLTPQATTILLDHAIPDSDKGLVLQVGVGLFVAALGAALFQMAQSLSLLRVETKTETLMQPAVWSRLLNLPVSFFRKYTMGDLLSRVLAITAISRELSGTTIVSFISGLFAVLYLALLINYNLQLSFVPIVTALATAAVTILSTVFLFQAITPLLELQGDINGLTVQMINGVSKLRLAGAEGRAFATWSKRYTKQMKLTLRSQNIVDWVKFFNTIIPTISSGAMFWLVLQLMHGNQAGMTVGTFLAFQTASGTFIHGVSGVSNTVSGTLRVVPQFQRMKPILEGKPEVEMSTTDPGRLIGRIAADHVMFRYRSDRPLILDDVNLHAEPGEFIALVGGSGSGKSTIFRLLLGFETPQAGAIYYDGQDLSGLDIDAVRRQLGVVLQNGRLMSASIFDNIAGGAQVSLNEAWEAAWMSGLADDIANMPMEMHTVISEGGSNISGGQRQRLLIARALVLKPRILLFDEATSALDNKTQAIVSQSLDQLQVTRVVIAHRLSTIRNADRIYVLNKGQLVQQGNFEELASQEGLFAQLMARQMA